MLFQNFLNPFILEKKRSICRSSSKLWQTHFLYNNIIICTIIWPKSMLHKRNIKISWNKYSQLKLLLLTIERGAKKISWNKASINHLKGVISDAIWLHIAQIDQCTLLANIYVDHLIFQVSLLYCNQTHNVYKLC